MSTFRGWAVTVRPRSGLTDEMISRAVKCFEKLDGAYAVTEKVGADRHLHAAMFLSTEVRKSQIVDRMKVVQGEMDDDELRVLKSGVKVLYNDEWYRSYLVKGDDTVVVYDKVPDDDVPYFPSQAQQLKAIGRSGNTPLSLVKMYTDSKRPVTLGNSLDFLRELWFQKRTAPPPKTEAMQFEEAKRLFCFLSLT